jgi:hypothetical protein
VVGRTVVVRHQQYRVANAFGSNIVTGEEARRVWASWPPDRRGGNPEYGFVIWDLIEASGQRLMSTAYIPLTEGET